MRRKTRIAIFHDYFGSIGGGEKLVLELAKGLDADIYTTELNTQNWNKINDGNKITITNMGPVIQFPILKQIHTSLLFYKNSIKNYDFYIMSGNWSIFACKKHHPNIHYIHTPPRMFYDSKEIFYRQVPRYARWVFILWTFFHQIFLEKQIRNIDIAVCNSKNVQKRTKKYYHIESSVIYPPIRQYKFLKFGDFWLSVNRFYPHKRIELQLEAFRKLPNEKLIIVGGYMKGDHAQAYYDRIMRDIPSNVSILGEVTEKELSRLYGKCKAFITTAQNEDFGMTVLEAMSAGKSVIAVNEGGYKETVQNGINGYLVNPNVTKIIEAINKISDNPSKFKNRCTATSKKYSIKLFLRSFKISIRKCLENE